MPQTSKTSKTRHSGSFDGDIEYVIRSPDVLRERIRDKVYRRIKSHFPIESDKYILKASNMHIVRGNFTLFDEKMHILKHRTMHEPIKADLELISKKTGKVIDSKKNVTIANIPIFTNRYGFIVQGNEYTIKNQFRIKPGVYTRTRENGDLESAFNLGRGMNFRLSMVPAQGILMAEFETSKIFAINLMRFLGASEKDIENTLGRELYERNRVVADSKMRKDLDKLVAKVSFNNQEITSKGEEKKLQYIRDYFNDTTLDKDTTKISLGREHDRVTWVTVSDAIKKLLRVNRGEEEEDDRDSLAFQRILTPDDHLADRIDLDAINTFEKIRRKMDNVKNPTIDSIWTGSLLSMSLRKFISTASLSELPKQINPIEIIERASTITKMGEGGIQTTHAIPFNARQTRHSQLGFLDPFATTENEKTGVDVRLTISAMKDKDGNPYVMLYDLKQKRSRPVKASELVNAKIGLPLTAIEKEKYWNDIKKGTTKGKNVPINYVYRDKILKGKVKDIDYIFSSTHDIFSLATNSVPFLEGIQGNRIIMAAKMTQQAMPLKYREPPDVQVKDKSGHGTMDDRMAKFFLPKSPVDGVVKKVTQYAVKIKGNDGKIYEVPYERNLPLSTKTYMDTEIKVKPGDKVKAGQILGDNNFTKDGKMALGRNMRIAYMTYYGKNSNDATVISESAAEKLTTEVMYKKSLSRTRGIELGKSKFTSQFPQKYTSAQLSKLADDGVAKKGQKLEYGDPVILAIKERAPSSEDIMLGRLSKTLRSKYTDYSVVWDKHDVGEVADIVKTGRTISVTIKTTHKARVGDKIVNRYGGKGVIGEIVPDEDMIKGEDGKPIDILFTQAGVVSRINPGQIIEASVGKAARKRGTPIVTQNFTGTDNVALAKQLLKKHGIKDAETVIDPKTGRKVPNIMVGNAYIYRLEKLTDTNYSGRSIGTYDTNEQPAKGGPEGAKSIGIMEINALVAHNARANLKEMSTIKSQRNDEYWKKFQLGLPTPTPRNAYVFDRFTSMLQGAGVKVEKDGSKFTFLPMTDKDVLKMTHGREIKEGTMVVGKNLKPERTGLFDQTATGGLGGEKWAHIKVEEPIINPVFKDNVRRILGVSEAELEKKIMDEGGEEIKKQLNQIDVSRKIEALKKESNKATGQRLDNIVKTIKFLENLKRRKLKIGDAVTLKYIPVIPPKMRPIAVSGTGSLLINDANYLYRDVVVANNISKEVATDEDKGKARIALQHSVEALFGLRDPMSPQLKSKKVTGFIQTLAGDSPKYGYFQAKVLKRPMDFTGRGTAAPDPTLDLDEVGIPEDMLWNIYKPFIIRSMVKSGVTAIEAKRNWEERTPMAKEHLRKVAQSRPVQINRAPTLHRFNIVGAYPKPIPGKTIRVNPLIETGMNLDYDGDALQIHVPVSDEAVEETRKKMLPSRILFTDKNPEKLNIAPTQDTIIGFFKATTGKTSGKVYKFKNIGEVMAAYKSGKVNSNDEVILDDDSPILKMPKPGH